MSSGRRELRADRRKINWFKVFIVLAVLVLAIVSIVLLVNNKKGDNKKDISKNNTTAENNIPEDFSTNNEESFKSIEQMLAEFGGEITEQVKSDTYYIDKNGVTYTAYENDEIVEGRITPWTGGSTQPAVDSAGNINIYSADELKWVADQVISGKMNFSGVTITLRQNIDLGARKKDDGTWEGTQWAPIIGFLEETATPENQEDQTEEVDSEDVDITNENLKRFAGVFDGNNFTIRGMYIDSDTRYQGLFGISTGTIQNLTMKNSYIRGNEVAGLIAGLNGGTILNCSVKNSTVKATSKVGGISGVSMGGSWTESSTVAENVSVIGEDYVGGIVGYINNNSALIKCQNQAPITGNNYVGGITGIAFYGTTIKEAVNNSNIISGSEYVGGIVGYSQAQIEDCTNMTSKSTGYIKGKEYVGGIVGVNYLMGDIETSINKANIIVETDNAGGIAGLNNANISTCYNSGSINALNCDGSRIGGLCGQNISESYINSSYNIGKIDYKKHADGVSGVDYGTITNCYYLNSSINSTNETYVKSSDELKNVLLNELGEYFKADEGKINFGYPVLMREVSEKPQTEEIPKENTDGNSVENTVSNEVVE